MCGRYTLVSLSEFTDLFPWIRGGDAPVPPRYNVAPTQPIAVVTNTKAPAIDFHVWGLVPSWAKDPSIGNRMINARAETLAEKPTFRTALKRRRCVVPADGFYEWKRNSDGKTKTPMHITLRSGKPFAFAGLWDVWHSADGSELPSATIITTAPNELMADIHDRMPVLLDEAGMKRWLDPAEHANPEPLLSLLRPFPADAMQARAVSKLVNNPRNEGPDLLRE
jgi:putative SOS response-associated peptidase YedK